MSTRTDVCGVEHAKWLDNGFRRLLQNPRKLFSPYIHKGNTVVDIGCGPGAFIPDLAKMVGDGKVIAVDFQEIMLAITKRKAEAAGVLDRVQLHKCSADSLNLTAHADFVLTFYMVHESPDPLHLTDQVCGLLNPGGYYYLSEPKFHVTENQYREVVGRCKKNGLEVVKECGIFSRTAVFRKKI